MAEKSEPSENPVARDRTANANRPADASRVADAPRPDVPDAVLERFRKATSATAYSAVWRLGPRRPGESRDPASYHPSAVHHPSAADHPSAVDHPSEGWDPASDRNPVLDSSGRNPSTPKTEWFASADYKLCLMRGVWPMTPGRKLVGRARTLRFLPARPDLLKITRRGADSPEYRAMGLCGPGDVLVAEAHAADPYSCILGNMKTRQLWHNRAEGIVTDGAIRDLELVSGYGLSVFAKQRSPAGNLPYLEAYEEDVAVNVGGVLVMPGDVIVGDDDGVVVVPADRAVEVISWIEEQEEAEEFVIKLIDEKRVPPGKYYPISEETKQRFREWKAGRG